MIDDVNDDNGKTYFEANAREEATLRTMLSTPPKPHRPSKAKRVESQSK